MKNITPFIMVLLVAFLTLPSRGSEVLLSDDFNSYTTGGVFSSNSLWGSVNGNTTDAILQVVQDTGNIFGEGTSNQYIRFADTGTNLLRMDSKTSSTFQIATLSFDMVEVSGVSGTSWFVTFYDASTSVFQLKFNGGAINDSSSSLYSLDTAVHIEVTLNTTISSVTYGSSSSVASMTYDLWIDGALVLDDVAMTGGTAGSSLSVFKLTTPSASASQEILLDNVLLVSIPEPSLLACLLLGGVFLCACRYLCVGKGGRHSKISMGLS